MGSQSSVARGLGGILTMVFHRSAATTLNGTLGSTVELLEAIRGKESGRLKDATLPIFSRSVDSRASSTDAEFSIGFREWIKEIGDQLKTAPTTRYPEVIDLSRMHGPSTVLPEDAARSFSPILNIGSLPGVIVR